MKKHFLLSLAALFPLIGPASAVVIADASYGTDTSLGTTQYFLEGATGGTTATWTINPGITVSGGRFFIGSTADPDDGLATLILNGGGTLDINRTGIFNLRLGQNNNSEAGALVISNGTTLTITGTTAGEFMEQAGGFIELDGLGSTFSYVNATTGTRSFTMDGDSLGGSYTAQNPTTGAIPFQLSSASETAGYTLQFSSAGGMNSISVVPEPATALLGGLGLLALLRRRRS